MSEPTPSTVKRLFAFSGNQCAFPKCKTPLVHDATVTADICHIRGRKPGAARYDANQTDASRHSFENLVLMCKLHHTIIDADEVSYTVERLLAMKREHGSLTPSAREPSDGIAAQLVASIYNVSSTNQMGGITAAVVNINSPHTDAQQQTSFSRAKLEAFLQTDRHRQVEITNGLWDARSSMGSPMRWESHAPIHAGIIEESAFELRIPVPGIGPMCLRLPYDLVDRAWLTADQRIAFRLNGRPVLRGDGISLEPAS